MCMCRIAIGKQALGKCTSSAPVPHNTPCSGSESGAQQALSAAKQAVDPFQELAHAAGETWRLCDMCNSNAPRPLSPIHALLP